jgi:F-type H+-transporting ATPase subunit a
MAEGWFAMLPTNLAHVARLSTEEPATSPLFGGIAPRVVGEIGGIVPVSNSITSAVLASGVLIALAYLMAHPLGSRRARALVELSVDALTRIAIKTAGSHGRRFVPLIGTAFIYILVANWLSTLPIKHLKVELDSGELVSLFRPAMSDLNLTAALAVIVLVVVEYSEIAGVGIRRYLRSLVVPNPLRLIEIISRPASLALRLFGNVLAGDVLVTVLVAIAPVVLFAALGLELFVGAVQALIFAMLTLAFLSIATVHERDEHTASATTATTAMPTTTKG